MAFIFDDDACQYRKCPIPPLTPFQPGHNQSERAMMTMTRAMTRGLRPEGSLRQLMAIVENNSQTWGRVEDVEVQEVAGKIEWDGGRRAMTMTVNMPFWASISKWRVH